MGFGALYQDWRHPGALRLEVFWVKAVVGAFGIQGSGSTAAAEARALYRASYTPYPVIPLDLL